MAPPTVVIEYHHVTLGRSTDARYELAPRADGSFTDGHGVVVDRAAIEALRSAASIDLQPGAYRGSCISHTDDYPTWKVTIGDLELASDSNCGDWKPWSVTIGAGKYAQYSGRLVMPLLAVLHALDRERWQWPPRAAGMPFVRIDETGSSAARACKQKLARDPAIGRALGDDAMVVGVVEDGDAWRATIAWEHFFVAVRATCNAKGEGNDFARALADAAAFAHRAPVAAFVAAEGDAQLDAIGPVWRVHGERLAGNAELTWKPGAKTVRVRATGGPLWTALQIDKKRSKGATEVDVPLVP